MNAADVASLRRFVLKETTASPFPDRLRRNIFVGERHGLGAMSGGAARP